MFGFGKKKKNEGTAIVSPTQGKILPLSEVPDPAFSGGALGEGFAVDTAGDEICSPVSGDIIVLFPTGHAFAVRSDSGVEVLVHIGVDTVSLKGDGFTKIKAQGDRVEAGEPVVRLDNREETATKVPSLATIVVVSNGQKFATGELSMGAGVGEAVMTATEK